MSQVSNNATNNAVHRCGCWSDALEAAYQEAMGGKPLDSKQKGALDKVFQVDLTEEAYVRAIEDQRHWLTPLGITKEVIDWHFSRILKEGRRNRTSRAEFAVREVPAGQPDLAQPETFLDHPQIFEQLNLELDKHIVGEHDTRKALLLIGLGGILVENASPTSKNLIVHDESGAGKDHVVRSVVNLLPSKNVITRKRISPTVFTYWHNAKSEPDWSWDGKLFYNEDITSSVLNSSVFKVMASSNGINTSTITVKNEPMEVTTVGKPVMIVTIANASLIDENLRRWPIARLNTTEAQTKQILERKAAWHETGTVPKYNRKITEALKSLRRFEVKVPFAGLLVDVLNTSHILIRTHYDRLIDYVKYSAVIHQYQRERDDTGRVIAVPADYDIAREVFIKTTSNAFSIPLTRHQEEVLNALDALPQVKDTVDRYGEKKEVMARYSAREILEKVSLSDRGLRNQLDKLVRYGMVERGNEKREGVNQPVTVFSRVERQRLYVPKYDEIASSANTASNDSITSIASKGGNN